MRYVTNEDLVSRTHFARFLVEAGHAKDTKDVFERYLTPGKPGHVAHEWATLTQAVDWIHGGRRASRHRASRPVSRDAHGDAPAAVGVHRRGR